MDSCIKVVTVVVVMLRDRHCLSFLFSLNTIFIYVHSCSFTRLTDGLPCVGTSRERGTHLGVPTTSSGCHTGVSRRTSPLSLSYLL